MRYLIAINQHVIKSSSSSSKPRPIYKIYSILLQFSNRDNKSSSSLSSSKPIVKREPCHVKKKNDALRLSPPSSIFHPFNSFFFLRYK